MSLHYLLDGYNIIHQAPSLAHGSLEERRKALVRWLSIERPHGSARNEVTVVFDGHPSHFGGMTGGGDIRIIFSDGQNADDHIKAAVENSRTPKNLVVVSDDKDIKLYARALGAGVLSVNKFAPGLFPAKGGSASGGKGRKSSLPQASEKYISIAKADKINKELEKLWLQ